MVQARGALSARRARDELRRTPLYDTHVRLGAKLVEFGGWEMPLSYATGTIAEHLACRRAAVVFDVSHLGTVRVEEPGSFELLQATLTNDLSKISPGSAQYTHLLADDGSVTDDLIVWWLADDVFEVMPNAANTSRVLAALGGADVTETRAVVAVQGPEARERLASVAPEAAAVARFCVSAFEWKGAACTAAGTGYTGEDGVECSVPTRWAAAFFDALLAAGVLPAGLGARDTLRLEAGLPLHGHELGPGITPLQAGLGWVVGWAKGDFRGRAALERERAVGPRRRLRGLVADGRQPPREGARVVREGDVDGGGEGLDGGEGLNGGEGVDGGGGVDGGTKVGRVTSGNFSPMLGRGIALAFVDTEARIADGARLTAVVRGRNVPVTVGGTRMWPPEAQRS